MTQSTSENINFKDAKAGNIFQRFSNFLRSSIRNRLTVIMVGAAIIPVLLISLILGWSTYVQVKSALTKDAFDKLSAVQHIKANQISSYLSDRQSDMVSLRESAAALREAAIAKLESVNALKSNQLISAFQGWDADVRDLASDPGVIEGMRALEAGFQEINPNQVRLLYLAKSELNIAEDGSLYSTAHLDQHLFFTGYTTIHSYEDAFLIDTAGNVVYSVQKTDVFGSNLNSGSYKDSNLAGLYQQLLKTPSEQTRIADTAFLINQYTMFIGTPIYDQQTMVGMLVYQLPLTEINAIVQDRTGLTASAETYLIGKTANGDIQLRTDRIVKEGSIGNPKSGIDSEKALAGESGSDLKVGSTGLYEISVFSPLNIPGLNWAVATTSLASEIFVPQLKGREQDYLTEFNKTYGLYDIFLISPDGFIFYSVAKEADFQTNILTGEYKDSNLGSLVAKITESKLFEFADFDFYAPSGGAPAAFFGIPLLNENNEIEMIVAAQASLEQINAITNEATGLGKTGETYMLGEDQLGRSDSRFLADMGVETTVLNEDFKVDTVASRSALAGESGQQTITDYRGLQVLSVWSPITINKPDATHPKGQVWALLAEIDESEALAPVNQLAGALGLVIGLAVLIIGALAVFLGARFAIGFVTPILNLTDIATQVAAGNMNLSVKTTSTDEIGTLSNAFNSMTSQLRDLIGSLEGRVAARTKDLATVAEVGTATATILETDKLMQAVVDLSKERFELYHSHIYLLDEAGENLLLTSGAGEPGRIMVAEKRSIPLDREQSLVARAAREGKGVTVNDVTQDPNFLPNPLLPDTRSELAVPMIVGGQVIGVFDVQSEQVGRFTDSDINIQTTLAAQVATSIQNVRSFEQAKAQADLESLVNTIGQKIQRATTVEDTLQTAIRELGLALGASRVSANIGGRQDGGNNASRN